MLETWRYGQSALPTKFFQFFYFASNKHFDMRKTRNKDAFLLFKKSQEAVQGKL